MSRCIARVNVLDSGDDLDEKTCVKQLGHYDPEWSKHLWVEAVTYDGSRLIVEWDDEGNVTRQEYIPKE